MQPLLTRYSIRPKKKLGQNFLTDDAVLRREVACADIAAGDTVLEIGAGIGNLTQLLLERAGQVVAVEQDRQFAPCLKDLQRRHEHLKVIWGDALAVDFPRFDKAVANLPYQVAPADCLQAAKPAIRAGRTHVAQAAGSAAVRHRRPTGL